MKKLDRFILRDILSDGSAGTVYKADEVLPGDNRRTVVVKVLPALVGHATGKSANEERFFGEVKVLAQLAVHPHIVTIYGMGLTDGYPWLAMEYAPLTLESKLADTPGDPAEIMRVLVQVGRGLAAMHALKPALIHQDLKPANILLDPLNNYKITDFSLATVTSANKTHGLATVRYAAPELLSSEFGRVGPHTDLYALGHIAYEMALGDRLLRQNFAAVYEGNSQKEPAPNKWMMWHASINMKPNPVSQAIKDFPAGLSELIGKLMAKSLGDRYASADELLGDLSAIRGEVGGGTRRVEAAGAGRRGAAIAPVAPVNAAPAAARMAPPMPAAQGAPAEAAPAAAPGSNTRYWVRLRGKVTGPFDLPTLQRQLKQGHISRLHQVSSDQVSWRNAAEIEGLYGPAVV